MLAFLGEFYVYVLAYDEDRFLVLDDNGMPQWVSMEEVCLEW
jgi:hypothetical protein